MRADCIRSAVLCVDDQWPTLDLTIQNVDLNIHHVQPLNADVLLVGSRSRRYGPDRFDLNGRVFDRQGQPVHSMLLGDGIQSVLTTSAGTVWTSCYDEGATRHPTLL